MANFTVYTDGGATSHDDHVYVGGWGVYIKNEDTEEEILHYGACQYGDTNNRAEQLAWIKAIDWLMANDATKVTFFLDSKYVMEGILESIPKWARRSWLTTSGTPVKNKDLWLEIKDRIDKVKSKGIMCQYNWVKGHSGVMGNEMADMGATRGTAMCLAGDFEDRTEPLNKIAIEKDPEAKAKKKAKIPEPYAMLCGRRMLEVANTEPWMVGSQRVYMTTSFDDKDKIKSRGLGVAAGDRFEGLVIAKTDDTIYDMIRKAQEAVAKPDVQIPYLMMWDKIAGAKNWKILHQEKESALQPHNQDIISWDKETQYTHYLNPARQARRCLEEMEIKMNLITGFLNGDDRKSDFIDITDMFIEANAKGKLEVKKSLTGLKALNLDYKVADGRVAKIIMSMDYEIPGRNMFAKLLKQDKEIKIELVIHSQTKNTFKWSLLVATPNGLGLYDNPSTNLYILPTKK